MNESRLFGAVCGTIFALMVNMPSNAADYTFTKIIDTSDPIPNGVGNFTKFSYPALDGRDIAFSGDGSSGYSGVYTYIGGNLNLIADTNTPIPGGTSNFVWFAEPNIDNGNIAFPGGETFVGDSSDNALNGIYTDLGGNIRVVADLNTPVPGGTGTFEFLPDEDFGISNGVVALTGFAEHVGQPGVYVSINGSLSVVADQNTQAPDGSGNYSFVSFNGMDGGSVAFGGGNLAVNGLYLNSGGTINTIIDTNTLIPGTTDTFTRITQDFVDVAEDTFVFVDGPDNAQIGLYSNVGGNIHLVAAIGDITPDGVGSFTFFDDPAVDGDELAFIAGDDNVNGNIFRYAGGMLNEVIRIDDVLDGKPITRLGMTTDSFDNSMIAFHAEFIDGSSGIYLAEVAPDSSTPVDLSGTIKTAGGTDICAMVLASGQFMFSCNPPGVFSLTDLPSDGDGTVKRQIYADGFFPEVDTFTGSSIDAVVMNRSGECPSYNTPYDPGVYPDSAGKRIDINGKVLLQDTQTPICAMVLANGKYMFSCDGSGSYALNIQLDANGQFKLQVYADGFAPTIQTFDEFQAINDIRMARAAECQ